MLNLMSEWYVVTLNKLIKVLDTVASKYTRSESKKSLPQNTNILFKSFCMNLQLILINRLILVLLLTNYQYRKCR